MNLRSIASKAKELVDKRGGTGALKEDADELKRIAQGQGSLTDKAKEAASALKEPGAREGGTEEADAPGGGGPQAPAAGAQAAEPEAGQGREGRRGEGRGRGQGKRRGGGGRGDGGGRDRV